MTAEPARRRGVYPGSFNPPTTAHLAIAEAARRQHELDVVVLTVSRSALAKEHVDHPRFDHRIDVIERVAADVDGLEVTVTEQQLLADIAEGYELLIVGADKWWQIQDPAWYGNDETARDAALAALPRLAVAPRDNLEVPSDHALEVPVDLIDAVSSTAARAGNLELMAPKARAFARQTGAWIDPDRYDRWIETIR